MNKAENVSHRKSVLNRGIDHKERDNDKKCDGTHRNEALNILLESDKFHQKEVSTNRKKSYNTETKGRKRNAVNVKVDYFEKLKSQLVNEKSSKKPQLSIKCDKVQEILQGNKKIYENGTSPEISTFSLKKSLIEQVNSPKTDGNSTPLLSMSRKASKNCCPTDVKLTTSEYRKIHINEILKNHAQKVQTGSEKSGGLAKENALQCVNEVLLKAKNFENGGGREQLLPSEPLTTKQTADALQGKMEENVIKKKITSKWIAYPQSTELERRLQGSWKENLFFRTSHNDENTLIKNDDDKTIKEEIIKDEERKGEKRITYTDRLFFLKNVKKNEKNSEESESEREKIERLAESKINEISKDLILSSNKPNCLALTKEPHVGTEAMLKPKMSRSAELRDLVNQAVKVWEKEHKIFCIFDSHWYIVRPVREELLNRGWLEVIPDRRLIPRRRPPPMGPLLDRDKSFIDRNCNTIEAILTAKENFVDELEETVFKSPSFRSTLERPKMSLMSSTPTKKTSDDSLKEAVSQFRITPPTPDKKKNNFEIREFVIKCQTMLNRDGEKDKKGKEKEKDKFSKLIKKEKDTAGKNPKNKFDEKGMVLSAPTPLNYGLQAMLDTMKEDRKTIIQAISEAQSRGLTPGEAEIVSAMKEFSAEQHTGEKDKSKMENESQEKGGKVMFKENEAKIISKIIQSTNAKIHFMWLSIKPAIHLKCFNYNPEIINKFQKTTFCTKIGLWNHLNNIQWYAHEVHFPAKSPRMYNTGEADDLQAFFQDFQLTACIGMLKWLADTFFDRGIKAVQTKKGKVPLKAFEFAIKQCERYVRFKDNEDLSIIEEPKVLQEEWNTFLQWFYTITNDHGKLQESSSAQLMVVYTKAVETLRTMKKHWPEIDIDGRLNIWIMKPYCASCGRGIFMTNNVYYIGQHSKYIVQKYIEKPLLIYNTKFDIRQWFMITKLTPLEIWMYKECYLRFCTQPFALRNLHESVHLSNNSVQRKYVNFRDPGLSDQNMWDSNTFQIYLSTIGYPNAWQDIIYPGMRDAIVSTMLAAQDNFDGPRRSWFEVYGADFMLSSNVKDGPWLIEINENPAMDPSTKVTARLCPQMLRDVIKVVVDKRTNKNASTGQWELVYRQNYSPSFGTVDLDVKGRKIARVPPTMKLEFAQNPTTYQNKKHDGTDRSKPYEVVKSFSDALKSTNEDNYTKIKIKKESQEIKLDPLAFLNKDKPFDQILLMKYEKYRETSPVEDARTLIGRVVHAEGEKSLKNGHSDNLALVPSSLNRQKLKKMRYPTIAKDYSKRTIFGKEERENVMNLHSNPKTSDIKIPEGDSEINKFKFTKFYKV